MALVISNNENRLKNRYKHQVHFFARGEYQIMLNLKNEGVLSNKWLNWIVIMRNLINSMHQLLIWSQEVILNQAKIYNSQFVYKEAIKNHCCSTRIVKDKTKISSRWEAKGIANIECKNKAISQNNPNNKQKQTSNQYNPRYKTQ